jgi:hypothetical protein
VQVDGGPLRQDHGCLGHELVLALGGAIGGGASAGCRNHPEQRHEEGAAAGAVAETAEGGSVKEGIIGGWCHSLLPLSACPAALSLVYKCRGPLSPAAITALNRRRASMCSCGECCAPVLTERWGAPSVSQACIGASQS